MLPPWTRNGLLPPGIHRAGWPEVMDRLGFSDRRTQLLAGFLDLAHHLADAGCPAIWLDGSFATDKERPSDYDACWDWRGVTESRLDPLLLDFTPTGRLSSKAKYLGDVFPAGTEGSSGLTFVDFFQRTRDGAPKGIVLIDPRRIP